MCGRQPDAVTPERHGPVLSSAIRITIVSVISMVRRRSAQPESRRRSPTAARSLSRLRRPAPKGGGVGGEAFVVGESDHRRRHPLEGRAVRLGDGGALEERLAVMPEETSAKPDVGNDAGQPMTKFAALNGVCWPTRISPALTIASTPSRSPLVVDGHLEVLGAKRLATAIASSRSAVRTQPPLLTEGGRAAVARSSGRSASCPRSSASTWRGKRCRRASRARPTSRCRARPRSAGRRRGEPGRRCRRR